MGEEKPALDIPGEEDSVTKIQEEAARKVRESQGVKEPEKPEETHEMKDVEILEFGLSKEEINELIEKLNHLKKNKTEVSFAVDDENEFLIKYLSGSSEKPTTDLSDMSMRG